MFVPQGAGAVEGDLTIRFWGVRGSIPTPGRAFARYGGNTACVEVRLGDQLFIIDAGSGLIPAGAALAGQLPARVDILLSHLHHDHIAGLPFFGPALKGNCSVRTYCGNLGGESAKAALDVMFAPPLFPVGLDALPAKFEHVGFRAGETLRIGSVDIATCPLFHPGGATGYRFDHGGRRVCYVSDLEHTDPWPAPHLVRFCQAADLVIFDSMYTRAQYTVCRGWGHSTWTSGVELCRAAGAKAMAAYHHSPRNTDDDLELIDAELRQAFPGSFVAHEGQTVVYHADVALAEAAVG